MPKIVSMQEEVGAAKDVFEEIVSLLEYSNVHLEEYLFFATFLRQIWSPNSKHEY